MSESPWNEYKAAKMADDVRAYRRLMAERREAGPSSEVDMTTVIDELGVMLDRWEKMT